MMLLLEIASRTAHFPLSFTLVYVVGFIAAITFGSIAWFNSKRPAGWEDKDRPVFVPKVTTESSPPNEPKA
ncbi:hypothetical protein DO97_14415 [Neosynechococcus sphagnicola sy1]|uniref:Uncharacterized protein n=1 Tax=Neosynechococcus sphagnicola sy1 TaxID=1497020 RepID=A0A098TIS2_9CYAN|nr:hypothetical protein [Neosynechococcus sphagnicola]KGF71936.1 hypothetical protein DO97_14415 [Neosynechococcus sphagnicola sy1]